MFGPENVNGPSFDGDRVIANLNPDNPGDKEIIDSLEESGENCRKEFPTVELAVQAYKEGKIMEAYLESGYPREEIDRVLGKTEQTEQTD